MKCNNCATMQRKIDRLIEQETYHWSDLIKLRVLMEHQRQELEAADQIIGNLRMHTTKPRPSLPSYPMRRASVRSVNFIRNHLTREEILQRVEADAAKFADETKEHTFDIQQALELSPDLPFQEVLGRGGVKLGSRLPRPGTWSAEGLAMQVGR
jgi:hypothetical protein